MKFLTYAPAVQKNTIGNANVQRYGSAAAKAIATAGQLGGQAYGNLARSVGQLAGAIQHQQENEDALTATAANNEYTKRINELMYNQENGLMNTKLDGASGITTAFEEQEKKIREEVGAQFRFHTQKGQMTFLNMANNSAAQRFENVRKHQTQQYNAYRDVTFGNAVENQAQFAMNNYADENALLQSMAETERLTMAQYYGQGDEEITAQVRKNCSVVAGRAIAAAVSNNDYAMVDNIRNRYGSYLTPEQSVNLMKISNKAAQENTELQLFKSAYAACGNNPEAIGRYVDDYCAKTGGNADIVHECFRKTKGQPYLLGAAEDGVNGNWDCGAWTKWVAKQSGLGSVITNRCADAQFKQMEDAGRAFGPNHENQLKTGDFVFWTGTGGEEGYKGISHVGIYNADTGKVMQSGTKGVAEIDLHAYPIVGFGRGAGGAGRTPAEVERLKSRALQFIQSEEGKKNAFISRQIQSANLELQDAMNHGINDINAYRGIVNKYITMNPGTPNDELRIRLETKLNAIQKGILANQATGEEDIDGTGTISAGRSKNGAPKSNPMAVYELGLRLQNGDSPEALRENVMSGAYSLQDKAKMMKMIDELDKTLTKDYNVDEIVKDMTAGYSGANKETYKKMLAAQTAGDIADFLGRKNERPTVDQIQQMVRYNMTKQSTGFMGDNVPAPVDFAAKTGADTYIPNERNGQRDGYNVKFRGIWHHISDRQMKAINDGEMTLQAAIREGYR